MTASGDLGGGDMALREPVETEKNWESEMARINHTLIRACLETLYFSGAHHIARPFLAGVGAVLTFHRVRPESGEPYQPNKLLEVTPDYLDRILARIRGDGVDIVTLDEASRRLRDGDFSGRFIALTFDDGYRDNRDHALPVLRKYDAPFTVYVPSSFAGGTGDLWWVALERAIARSNAIELAIDGKRRVFQCRDVEEKIAAERQIYWWLRGLPHDDDIRRIVAEIAAEAGVDTAGICPELCMDWDELRDFGKDGLVTFGAHTVTHPILSKISADRVEAEMRDGAAAIEKELGVRPTHFAYPLGDPPSAGPREFEIAGKLGFRSAVTTRPGVIFADHAEHMTALPRMSMNGSFQRLRYFEVLLSGAPTALRNRFRRVDAA
jgi:peptidoglycan/xylan/chitin deacetylase (PgdA/CDA1 family)